MAQDVFYCNTNDAYLNTFSWTSPPSTGWVYARDATGSFSWWYGSPVDEYNNCITGGISYNYQEYHQMQQAYMEFDTSSLPDNATITSATFSLVSADSSFTPSLNVWACDWGGGTLSNSDWHTKAQIDAMTKLAYYSGSFTYDTRCDFTSTGSMISAINKTGYTRFAVLHDSCQSSSYLPNEDYSYEAQFWSTRKSGQETYHPRLVVDYYTSTVPTVSTTYISSGSIDINHAHGGGNVTSDGGASVTAKGNVWAKHTAPVITSDTHTHDGTGTGSFTSTLTPLDMGVLYYYRAYATNSEGTAYGSQYTLTTVVPEPNPFITTPVVLVTPEVEATSVIPVAIELENALSAEGDVNNADASIGLSKPQLTLSLPDVENIRVDWS